MDKTPLWKLDRSLRLGVTCAGCGARRTESVRMLCDEGRLRDLPFGGLESALRCANRKCGAAVRVAPAGFTGIVA